MRRIESIEDQLRGFVTLELSSGARFRVAEREYRELGPAGIRRIYGGHSDEVEDVSEHLPVFQGDRQIGTLTSDFDPMVHASRSFMYDIRPGDFRRSDRGWEADRTLGPGDLSAVPGFQWADDPLRSGRDVEADRDLLRRAISTKDRRDE